MLDINYLKGQLILGNGTDSISIKDIDLDRHETETVQASDLSIEDIYKITKGRISYEKAKIAIEFVTKTSQSRSKAIEYADIIRALTSENSQLAKVVEDECFAIDKDIISREDRRGLKIAESVNIGLKLRSSNSCSRGFPMKSWDKLTSCLREYSTLALESGG